MLFFPQMENPTCKLRVPLFIFFRVFLAEKRLETKQPHHRRCSENKEPFMITGLVEWFSFKQKMFTFYESLS